MPPHHKTANYEQFSQDNSGTTGILYEHEAETSDGALKKDIAALTSADCEKLQIVWLRVLFFGVSHIAAFYGGYLALVSAQWKTNVFAFVCFVLGTIGTTVGSHRLYSHRSFKAKWPLQIMLIIMQTMSLQFSLYHWVRDHRVHHKYTETNADPHNANRGFFFSQIGWLLCKKHPDVVAKSKTIDFSDLENNYLIMFQHKYYIILSVLFCFIVPTIIPMYFWNETIQNGYFVAGVFRWIFSLHTTGTVNSLSHMYGNKPYDKDYKPAENKFASIVTFGEGWHNYHHAFPWDFRTSEFGFSLNWSTAFIRFFAKIGWAYDLKTVSPEVIKNRVKRTGDGTHPIWGWGDKDQSKEEIETAITLNRSGGNQSFMNKLLNQNNKSKIRGRS
ncbi:acyl-CoA Delta-9 desaturase-like [Haematobia irritans]|uniref:acyl-CoA Delta-9 desaturase-like n=1 Tax=Haematobia irritans TaxID=7368 RepID=UPI003F4FC7C8